MKKHDNICLHKRKYQATVTPFTSIHMEIASRVAFHYLTSLIIACCINKNEESLANVIFASVNAYTTARKNKLEAYLYLFLTHHRLLIFMIFFLKDRSFDQPKQKMAVYLHGLRPEVIYLKHEATD